MKETVTESPRRLRKNVRLLSSLVFVATLAACQSTPRHFDGAVGYTFTEQKGRWTVTYTDEASHDWSELKSGALSACANETGRPVSELRLANLDRSEFVRNVPVAIRYPAGVISTQTGFGGRTGAIVQEAPHTLIQTETVTRRIAFRKVRAVCQTG